MAQKDHRRSWFWCCKKLYCVMSFVYSCTDNEKLSISCYSKSCYSNPLPVALVGFERAITNSSNQRSIHFSKIDRLFYIKSTYSYKMWIMQKLGGSTNIQNFSRLVFAKNSVYVKEYHELFRWAERSLFAQGHVKFFCHFVFPSVTSLCVSSF